MAEWQTRTVQVRVSVRTWGFNSPLAHTQVPEVGRAREGVDEDQLWSATARSKITGSCAGITVALPDARTSASRAWLLAIVDRS